MEEGKIVEWWAKEGDVLAEGDDLVDIETTKITNLFEAHTSGTLRRIVAEPDAVLPVGALIGIFADEDVKDQDIDDFIEQYQSNFDPAEAQEESAGPEIRSVEVYGRTLRVGVMGEGRPGVPLVLLHGFGGDLNNWMLVQPALSEMRPVYSIELPGHGLSAKDVGGGTLSELAAGIVAAIDALNLKQVGLAGHSLGGAIAIEVANRLGDRVTSLGLVCAAGLSGDDINSEYLDAFVSSRRARDMRAPAALLFASADLVTKELLEELIKAKRLDGAEAALSKIKDNLKGDDPEYSNLGTKLMSMDVPLIVISTKSDEIVGQLDTSLVPEDATIIWVDGAGHMPHLERAGEVVDALLKLS